MNDKRVKTVFACGECGAKTPRWMGRCTGCGAWNTLVEERATKAPRGRGGSRGRAVRPVTLGDVGGERDARVSTGMGEFDRVLGGGLVEGSVVLLGGEPGIGKSTLLLSALSNLTAAGHACLYVSAEESAAQVALRARRLGGEGMASLRLLPTTELEDLEAALEASSHSVVVVDSIQTLRSSALTSAPGSVAQIREVAGRLVDRAKRDLSSLILVGHVTKEGSLAGPKVLEHLVDTVLSFEADASQAYRLLRADKNRFGPSFEVGVFEMAGDGLHEVEDPSALFLAERPKDASGSVVLPSAEGSRALLVELQALVAPALYGAARRVASGLDGQRLAILLAVLDRKAGVHVLDQDVFASVAGGARVVERAADLALAVAIVSSFRDRPLAQGVAVFGEVGLAGEVRAVPRAEVRVREAAKLGFERVILPRANMERSSLGSIQGVELDPVSRVEEALERI